MNKIFTDLYYGRYNPYERKPYRASKDIAVNQKIAEEKRYFLQKMSEEDAKRFEALEDLYNESDSYGHIDAFSYGFKFATTIICAVFMDENELTQNKKV